MTPAPEPPSAIERERNELRSENRVLRASLASTQSQLAKCRIQRERFHAQLRAKHSTPPT